MARILAAIGLAIFGAIPFSAVALGLGEIDLKSALNQPFSAEILVVSETPGDLGALRVDIAPIETFKQFGIDAQRGTDRRMAMYEHLAKLKMPNGNPSSSQ